VRLSAAALLALCAGCAPSAEEPSPRPAVSTEEQCVREVEELHRFFTAWFRGELPAEDEAFARFAGVLSPSFEILPPDGGTLDRDEILASVRGAHGAHAGTDFRIWIEDASARWLGDGMLEATYEEWQTSAGETRGRRSRALLRQHTGAPNGVQWVRVEETWLE